MSTVSGSVTKTSKRGRKTTSTKIRIANKTKAKKRVLIPPAKAAEFVTKLKALAKRYNLKIDMA